MDTGYLGSKLRLIFNFNSVLILISFITALIGLFDTELPAYFDATIYIFALYILIIAILLAWREFQYSRKARFAEAMPSFHQCSHALRDAADSIRKGHKESAFQDFSNALSEFQKAFSIVTGASCRACIKTIVWDEVNQSTLTETFARSKVVNVIDGCRREKDKPTVIQDNSDFQLIFEDELNYFFSNDLSKEQPYLNSNWPKKPSDRQDFIKSKKYDYISSIVIPIRGKELSNKPEMIGFLCIDSKTRGIFTRRYDFDAIAIFADTLYSVLLDYQHTFVTGQLSGADHV